MAKVKTQKVNNFSPKEKKKGRQDKKYSKNNKSSKLYKKKYKGQGR